MKSVSGSCAGSVFYNQTTVRQQETEKTGTHEDGNGEHQPGRQIRGESASMGFDF
jgi:hypothetical protein